MSFSGEIKQELCRSENLQHCCLKAQTAGILMFAKSFSAQKILFSCEHRASIELAAGRLAELFGVITEITVPLSARGKTLYTLTVPDSNDRLKLSNYYRDYEKLLKKSCCTSAFIGGVFLACGTAADPAKKSYRLEFNVGAEKKALMMKKMLSRLEISCSVSERSGVYVVYLNEREPIIDLLGYIGAVSSYWKLFNTAVERDYRNRATRITNCDNANINRTADAAAVQLVAIKKLAASGILDTLSEQLRQVAALRTDNPEASLRELCELTDNTVTRSSMNRRLAKLVELAEE